MPPIAVLITLDATQVLARPRETGGCVMPRPQLGPVVSSARAQRLLTLEQVRAEARKRRPRRQPGDRFSPGRHC